MDERPGHTSAPAGPASGPAHTVTREDRLPRAVEGWSGLARVDYADAFRTTSATTRVWTARQWATHVLEGAPLLTRVQLVGGWLSLGLAVNPVRGGRVLGWRVREEAPDHLLLGADSPIGLRAELLFARCDEAWWFGTRLRLENAVARCAWAPVARVHPGAVVRLHEDADARLPWAQERPHPDLGGGTG